MVYEDFNRSIEDVRYANPPGDLDAAVAALDGGLRAHGRRHPALPRDRGPLARAQARARPRPHRPPPVGGLLVQRARRGSVPAEQSLRLELVATVLDVYLWKLHRRDLGRSREETTELLRTLVRGILERP